MLLVMDTIRTAIVVHCKSPNKALKSLGYTVGQMAVIESIEAYPLGDATFLMTTILKLVDAKDSNSARTKKQQKHGQKAKTDKDV